MAVDRSALVELLRQFKDSLAQAEYGLHAVQVEYRRQEAKAQAEVDKFALAVRGIEAVTDEGDDSAEEELNSPQASNPLIQQPSAKPPRGRAAVRMVLNENVGQAFTPAQLAEELVHRGWVTPDAADPAAAARSAANRLRAADKQYVFENGAYSYRPFPASPFRDSSGEIYFRDPESS